jgi:hypothetical protein
LSLEDDDDGNWSDDSVTFDVDQGVAVARPARHFVELGIGQLAEFIRQLFHSFLL